MKKKTILIMLSVVALALQATAQTIRTVSVAFNGSTATVTMTDDISSYVTVTSGTSSHVKLVQSDQVNDAVGEIYYVLSGTTTDGEFYLEGSYKCTLTLSGVSITNPSGPAINIQNGKRVEVSVKNGTTSRLVDGPNEEYNGAYHCKGHTKFKGKGTLYVTGNSRHAIYSKEYIEVKNCTINVVSALKDGMHCKQYFLMESGVVNIASATDDGIQVELKDAVSTGVTTDHEDEDTGNFYMTGGTLTISNVGNKNIKADGTISLTGGTKNFDTSNIEENAASGVVAVETEAQATTEVFDLAGRRLDGLNPSGISIIREGDRVRKVIR